MSLLTVTRDRRVSLCDVAIWQSSATPALKGNTWVVPWSQFGDANVGLMSYDSWLRLSGGLELAPGESTSIEAEFRRVAPCSTS